MAEDPNAAWARVGQALTARVFTELRLTKAELIRRSGISDKTIDRYLAGKRIVRRDKERALCAAVNWESDSIQRILDGKEPAAARPLTPSLEECLIDLQRQIDELRVELMREREARGDHREPNGSAKTA